MACFKPMNGWYAKTRNEKGKREIVFRQQDGLVDRPVVIPCGRCVGCELEKARVWAVRCMHEASLYERNSFVTLTYSPEAIDPGGSLVPHHFQTFMKRLRYYERGVRYFQCGEYGEKLGRPHHHALLFNCEFSDKVRLPGTELFTSGQLEELWPHGHSSIGEVTFESAGYVARYAMKKIRGDRAAAHYGGRVPEYATMSRKPGIGTEWVKKFWSDVYPSGQLVVNGVPCKPPRFYDDVVYRMQPWAVTAAKEKRQEERVEVPGTRLMAGEIVKQAQIRALTRALEG